MPEPIGPTKGVVETPSRPPAAVVPAPSALPKDVVILRFADGREMLGRMLSFKEGAMAATVTVEAIKPEALGQVGGLEQEMLGLVNQERQARGLAPLTLSPALSEVARRYAGQMIKGDFFAHQDPQGKGMVERVQAAGLGYQRLAENLSYAPDLATSHHGLMESPGHRRNLLSPDVTEAGIGIQVVMPEDPFSGGGKANRPLVGYLVVTQLFRRP